MPITFDDVVVNTGTLTNLDSFEDYTAGNNLASEAAEWHSDSHNAITVQSDGLHNSQSVGEDGSSGYDQAQSNTDSSTSSNQSATFSSYPFADCTIRCAIQVNTAGDTNDYAEVQFAIPSGESDGNNNCYRVRASDSVSGNEPFLRRTVNGSSTVLAQYDSLLTSGNIYDCAIEFEDDSANSDVNLTLQIWEWDSANSQWVDWNGSISGTDGNYNFPDEGGIGVAVNPDSSGDSIRVDHYRFWDVLGKTGEPQWTP